MRGALKVRPRVWNVPVAMDGKVDGMADGSQVPAMPLSLARSGETVVVRRVRGDEGMRRHLGNLGFVDGAEVRVVSVGGGNVIVDIKGARLGLDARAARHIMTA